MSKTEDQRWIKLFEYLDKKFAVIDQRFVVIDGRFDQIEERFKRVDSRFDRQDSVLDSIFKRLDNHEVEQSAIKMQLDRHDNWAQQLAAKTKTKLDY